MQEHKASKTPWADFKKWWVLKEGRNKHLETNGSGFYGQNPLISPAMNVSNCVIAVIDIPSMMYIYTSPNYSEFTGWNWTDIKTRGVQFAFSRVQPIDQLGITHFSELINTYFRKLPDAEKGFYRSIWDYRVRNNKGELLKVLQQDCALKYDSSGQIEELLVFVSKIENVISSENQHLRLTNGKGDLFYKYDQATKLMSELTLLSQREMEIVKLIARSKSMKQIADELKISFNTVKAHSTKIMQKLQVKDSLEMVNLLRVWGFI